MLMAFCVIMRLCVNNCLIYLLYFVMIFVLCEVVNCRSVRYNNITKNQNDACPSGNYFDKQIRRCRIFPGGGTVVHVDYQRRCSNNNLRSRVHPEYDQYYYVCKNNSVIFGKCPNGQTYNSKINHCTFATATSGESKEEEATDCRGTGRHPVISNCSLYYICDRDGQKYIRKFLECPKSTLYNPLTGRCSYIHRCTPTEINPGDVSDEYDYETFPPCKRPGRFRSPVDCSLYFTCSVKTRGKFYQTRYRCPAGTLYDLETQICRKQKLVECKMLTPENYDKQTKSEEYDESDVYDDYDDYDNPAVPPHNTTDSTKLTTSLPDESTSKYLSTNELSSTLSIDNSTFIDTASTESPMPTTTHMIEKTYPDDAISETSSISSTAMPSTTEKQESVKRESTEESKTTEDISTSPPMLSNKITGSTDFTGDSPQEGEEGAPIYELTSEVGSLSTSMITTITTEATAVAAKDISSVANDLSAASTLMEPTSADYSVQDTSTPTSQDLSRNYDNMETSTQPSSLSNTTSIEENLTETIFQSNEPTQQAQETTLFSSMGESDPVVTTVTNFQEPTTEQVSVASGEITTKPSSTSLSTPVANSPTVQAIESTEPSIDTSQSDISTITTPNLSAFEITTESITSTSFVIEETSSNFLVTPEESEAPVRSSTTSDDIFTSKTSEVTTSEPITPTTVADRIISNETEEPIVGETVSTLLLSTTSQHDPSILLSTGSPTSTSPPDTTTTQQTPDNSGSSTIKTTSGPQISEDLSTINLLLTEVSTNSGEVDFTSSQPIVPTIPATSISSEVASTDQTVISTSSTMPEDVTTTMGQSSSHEPYGDDGSWSAQTFTTPESTTYQSTSQTDALKRAYQATTIYPEVSSAIIPVGLEKSTESTSKSIDGINYTKPETTILYQSTSQSELTTQDHQIATTTLAESEPTVAPTFDHTTVPSRIPKLEKVKHPELSTLVTDSLTDASTPEFIQPELLQSASTTVKPDNIKIQLTEAPQTEPDGESLTIATTIPSVPSENTSRIEENTMKNPIRPHCNWTHDSLETLSIEITKPLKLLLSFIPKFSCAECSKDNKTSESRPSFASQMKSLFLKF